MNRESVVEAVRRHFGFLHENGELRIVTPQQWNEQSAGWVIEVVSEAFCVRLILDRGQVFVGVGSGLADGHWHDLGPVVSYLTDEKNSFQYSIPEGPITDELIERQIARGAEAVRDHRAKIASFFSPEGFETRESALVAFRNEQSEERWKRLLR